MIRILHIITRMVRGGAQENTLANVAGLTAPEWESSLATGPALGPEGSLEDGCRAAGIRMFRIPDLVRELSPAADWRALQALTGLCRKERPHIVHTHTSKAGILGRIAARRAGVPIVVHTPHGHVFHSYEGRWKTRLFLEVERACARRADRLVALTENERREHLELGVGAPEQWRTIHSGVDFSPFNSDLRADGSLRARWSIPPEARVVGTVGRLVPIKGQSYLLDAFAEMAEGDPNLHLVLVGDGELKEPLLARCRDLRLNPKVYAGDGVPDRVPEDKSGGRRGPTVHFAGLRHDVARCMAVMDIFVLPSLNEGMGRVLVEAMAMGLPCIGSRVSGIPDVVMEGETGLLTEPRDVGGLARAMANLLANPERARGMGDAGRRRVVPEFGQPRMLEKLEQLYRELLADRGVAISGGRPTMDLRGDGPLPVGAARMEPE